MQALLEAGKDKKVESPLEPLEGRQTNQHLDFRKSNFQNCCVKPLNFGDFISQPLETNDMV